MAKMIKTTGVKKTKKHGKTNKVKPSQKKSVKNGRHQEKKVPKCIKKKIAKAVAAIPADLDGEVLDDEMGDFLQRDLEARLEQNERNKDEDAALEDDVDEINAFDL